MVRDDDPMHQFAKALLETRRAWWLGAGASFAAGVPTVDPLRTRILKGLGLSDADVALLEDKAIPFEALFEVLLSGSDCTALFDVFNGNEPALAHLLLARLAERGLVRTIVTTNFDTLLEDALADRGIGFDVYSKDEEFTSIDWSDDRFRLVKLHGSLDAPDELAVTIRRVAARQHADRRGEVIRQLFNHEPSGGVVILGYSCSDHFDVSPAARRYSRTDRRVWYVDHKARRSETLVIAPLSEGHTDNPFSGYDARSAKCAADALLKTVWRELLGESPPVLGCPTRRWEECVDSWVDGLVSNDASGQPLYLAGLVLKTGNLWKRSNVYLYSAIAAGLNETTHSRALLVIGNNLRDLGEYEESHQVLSEAELRTRDSGDLALKARVINSLGIVAADEGDFDAAIALYERTLNIRVQDEELIGKCHGNLGIALKKRNSEGDLDRALPHHQRAYSIAQNIGDKRSEGRTLGNIGLVYAALGDLRESCKYYRAAREVADSLGDFLHVAIWLHNEGEDTANTDPAKAKKLLERSREIFISLGQMGYAAQSSKLIAGILTRENDDGAL